MKPVEDYPIEDIFGDEICTDDVYFIFGKDVVIETNLKRYLIEKQQFECFRAQ
ncbi:TPA: hypothetical protein ACG1DY_004985 [Escherichia coli]